jgi:replicative DNA helicase
MGKTALAMNIAERIALGRTSDRTPRPVGVFSLEMSTDALVIRMLCAHARVPSHVLTKGMVSVAAHGLLVQAAAALTQAPIYVDETPSLEIETLRAIARRMRKKHGVEIILIDYLQLVRCRDAAHRSRNEEVAGVSAGLKAMAKELGIPVVVLSQLNRSSENDGQRKPRLSDLRDSGAIEQDADVVCLLRRPCKVERDERHDDETLAIVDVAKHRNGPTGEIELNFEDEYTRFDDRAHGTDPEAAYAQEVAEGPAMAGAVV